MKKLHLLSLLLLFGFLGCKKDDLPEPSIGGPNLIACKINGKKWVPQGKKGIFSDPDPYFGGFLYDSFYNLSYFVFTGADDAHGLTIYFGNANRIKEGTIDLIDDNFCAYPVCEDTAINFISLDGKYFTGSQVPRGTNYVKFDYVYSDGRDEVIARFAFVGIDKDGNKINVSDGRFHFKNR